MKKKLLGVAGGMLLGVVGEKILKSDTTKKLVVDTVSGGLKIKDTVDKTIEKAKENAEDIVVEAKVKNAEEQKAKEEAEAEAEAEVETIEVLAEEATN
nr:DUF6110 family protein [uncultured Peptoniphilus sp.]